MPELPDLEVISSNLNRLYNSKKLLQLNIYKEKKLNAPISQFKYELENKTLTSIERNGKELLLKFENHSLLGIHLMLKGAIHLSSEPNLKNKIFDSLK